VVRLRVAEVLKKRGISWYRLALMTGLSQTQVYRMRHAEGHFGRFTQETLDKLCAGLDVQPGDILEYIPTHRIPRPRTGKRSAH
jgi:DNA-binding Xre family transcriptional regulator